MTERYVSYPHNCVACARRRAKLRLVERREQVKATADRWRLAHVVQMRAYRTKWRRAHPAKARQCAAAYLESGPEARLRTRLRKRLYHALVDGSKVGSAVRDLGCTIPELRLHLEKLFQSGMTWENWSPTGWHIDHIKPLANFDLTDRPQFLKACHYTNLQPLWASDNLAKGAREAA
jgi:hypothetical protein